MMYFKNELNGKKWRTNYFGHSRPTKGFLNFFGDSALPTNEYRIFCKYYLYILIIYNSKCFKCFLTSNFELNIHSHVQ